MSFGFSTIADLLCWTAMALLSLKLFVTIVLLLRPRATWFDTLSGAAMWWASKITPVIAVPCLIAAALLLHDRDMLRLFSALMVFVAVAVPWKIWSRFYAGRAKIASGTISSSRWRCC